MNRQYPSFLSLFPAFYLGLCCLLPFSFISCTSGENEMEQKAAQLLSQARNQLSARSYDQARQSIETLRNSYPTALQARAKGIVVMDSIELCEAQDSLIIADSILQQEQNLLATLKQNVKDTRESRNEVRAQEKQVFYVRQHYDEISAKVKFYLRKIELDMKKNLETD